MDKKDKFDPMVGKASRGDNSSQVALKIVNALGLGSIEEAKEYIRLFANKKGRNPKEDEMLAFWPLFAERNEKTIKESKLSG